MLVCVERSEPQLLTELGDKICVARVDFEMSERTDLNCRRPGISGRFGIKLDPDRIFFPILQRFALGVTQRKIQQTVVV